MTNDDKLMTVEEACDFLNVNPWTLRLYIRDGKIKANKIFTNGSNKKGKRGRWRIWKHDLVEFLERGSNIKQGG